MKKLFFLVLLLPITVYAGGVSSIKHNSTSGNSTTYDVFCKNGSHGYVSVTGSAISWTSSGANGRGFTNNVSINDAARKICR